MKAHRRLIPFLVGLVAFDAAPVRACPIQQRSLWSRIAEAELIALVSVEAFEQDALLPLGSEPDGIERNVAVLKILVTYKGALRSGVRVNFSDALYAGDHEVAVGDQLMVFLQTGETQIRWSLGMASAIEMSSSLDGGVGRSDGIDGSRLVIVSDSADFEDPSAVDAELQDPPEIREAKRRWQESRLGRWFFASDGSTFQVGSGDRDALDDLMTAAVRSLESGDLTDEGIREWLIQAASLRATRFDAVFDLMASAVSPEGWDGEIQPSGLSDSEKRSIAAAFVRDPTPDWSLSLLLSLLTGLQDADLDRTLVAMVDAAIAAPKIPDWVPEAIRFLVASHGWRDWGSEMYRRDLESGELKGRWPLIAKDLQLNLGSAGAPR